MTKTAKDWFITCLTTEQANLAIWASISISESKLIEQHESLESALLNSFIWSDTEEGHNYWHEIRMKSRTT